MKNLKPKVAVLCMAAAAALFAQDTSAQRATLAPAASEKPKTTQSNSEGPKEKSTGDFYATFYNFSDNEIKVTVESAGCMSVYSPESFSIPAHGYSPQVHLVDDNTGQCNNNPKSVAWRLGVETIVEYNRNGPPWVTFFTGPETISATCDAQNNPCFFPNVAQQTGAIEVDIYGI